MNGLYSTTTTSQTFVRIKDTIICTSDLLMADWDGRIIFLTFKTGKDKHVELDSPKAACAWLDVLWKSMGDSS